jgi:hypothetical protein
MSKKINAVSLFNEINQVFKKYGLPRGIGFVPNKININFERKNESLFSLIYEEYFTYLPDELLDDSRENAIDFLKKFGVPSDSIIKFDKGVQVKLEGDVHIIDFPILELIIQNKNFINDMSSLCDEVKSSLTKLTELFELTYDIKSEDHLTLVNYLGHVRKILEDNPEIQLEIEEIVKKYTQILDQS